MEQNKMSEVEHAQLLKHISPFVPYLSNLFDSEEACLYLSFLKLLFHTHIFSSTFVLLMLENPLNKAQKQSELFKHMTHNQLFCT